MTSLIEELLEKATPSFREYRVLSANCPLCNSRLVIKYRSRASDSRKLSVIIACSNNCDKAIWNTAAKEGFTHWWLDGSRDREGYKKIIASLTPEEKHVIRELEHGLRVLVKTGLVI